MLYIQNIKLKTFHIMAFYNTPAFTKYINENKEFTGYVCRLINMYCYENIKAQNSNHRINQIMVTAKNNEKISKLAIEDAIKELVHGDEERCWSIIDGLYQHLDKFAEYVDDSFVFECVHQILNCLNKVCDYINERLIEEKENNI